MNGRITWIEIMIIVAILAILALWLFPRVVRQIDSYTPIIQIDSWSLFKS